MDQDLGGNGAGRVSQGNEDASAARRHVHNAEENRDALAAQSRRVEETAPAGPSGSDRGGADRGGTSTGGRTGGMSAAETRGEGSEDASMAREHVRNVEENRDALEAQSRRVEATAPEETRHDLRDR